MLTIGLPTYNNSDIIWLQIESLCRQVDAPIWELVVVEEKSDNYFGKKELLKYKSRLVKAGCVDIKYISLDEWIPLGKKWMVIRDNMNKDSIGMLLCASDNYSPSERLKKSHEAFKKGADWFQFKAGYFYNILTQEAAKFEMILDNRPSLFMSVSRAKLMSVKSTEFPSKGVDTWLMKNANIKNLVQEDFAVDGVHTDGFNTISHGRRLLYKGSSNPLFTEIKSKEVHSVFPKEIQDKLLKLKKMAEKKKQTKKQAVKKLYNTNEVVKFQSNGKSKHLPYGEIFELTGEKANLFIKLDYGKVVK